MHAKDRRPPGSVNPDSPPTSHISISDLHVLLNYFLVSRMAYRLKEACWMSTASR